VIVYTLRWSPPSERVRWVLRARGVPFREIGYVPMPSPMAMRIRRATGKASVPVAFVDGKAIAGSTEIARHADALGTRGESYFFDGDDERCGEIAAWEAIAEDVFLTARDLFGPGFGRDRDALRAVVDPLPAWGRMVFPLVWRMAGASFADRYRVGSIDRDAANRRLRERLAEVESRRAGRPHLVGGRVSYADVALATYLSCVRPPPRALWPIPDPIARHFATVPEPGPWDALFAWRDRVWSERS